jgi:hypothetical protein
LEKTIGQSARFLHAINNGQSHPAILGIEPFNEPHPVGLPKEQFEFEMLVDYYRNVNSELKKYDPGLFIFMEPRVDWTVAMGSEEKSALGSSPFSAKSAFHMSLVKNVMLDGRIDSRQLQTYLPKNLQSVSRCGINGVLSFHYYDTTAMASSFLKIPESMYTYKREWPVIFGQLVQSAKERGLVPFLTEFGAFQDGEQVREYLNLQFEQIEAHLLNSTYWNYDLYHTADGKDNWNLEDFSFLGPNRTPRNVDILARPYPMRSSAEPILLFFDIESKYATIILKGVVVNAPTIIYIPFKAHYAPEFSVWATGSQVSWNREDQLLHWYPTKDSEINQIAIGKGSRLNAKAFPDSARDTLKELALMGTFS